MTIVDHINLLSNYLNYIQKEGLTKKDVRRIQSEIIRLQNQKKKMLIKAKNGLNKDRIFAGVHLVSIASLSYAKNEAGEIRTSFSGDPGIEITFKNKEGKTLSQIFWLSDDSIWALHKLCKAIGFEDASGIDIKDAKGKKLWVVVSNEYHILEGVRKKDMNDNDLFYPKLLMKFFPAETKPFIPGDPEDNDGIPSGIFTIEKNVIS